MKQPYFNRGQRELIYAGTTQGDHLLLNLAVRKALRDVRNSEGWFAMKKMERKIVKLVNDRIKP
jgi:hypothetical protein